MLSLFNKSLIIFIISCLSITSFASSTGSYGGSSRGGNYGDTRQQRKPVDQKYELGKAIYRGKSKNGKLKYCVENGNQKVKLKSKTAKNFKNKDANAFSAALYDCNSPETQVANILDNQDLYLVVYYLNKRYRLQLKGI